MAPVETPVSRRPACRCSRPARRLNCRFSHPKSNALERVGRLPSARDMERRMVR